MQNVSIYSIKTDTNIYPNVLYIFDSNKYPKISPKAQKTNTSLRSKTNTLSKIINTYSHVQTIVSDVVQRVLFLNKLLNTNNLPNRLIIFLTKAKKEIDNELEIHGHFRTLNINTAVTNMRDIIIYREEELLKSVFHELIHFHNLDYKILPSDARTLLLDYFQKSHNISTDNEYLIYESITESLANVLNNLFLSNTLSEFANNLEDEILFSTYQIYKILRVCKYTSWEEFTLLHDVKPNSNKHWKQDSCVFSYYVLKLYILLNLDEYWNDILDENLKFHPTITNFQKLISIFEKGRNNTFLKDIINNMLAKQTKMKTTKRYKTTRTKSNRIIINKTLRMTCLDKS